MLIQAANCSFAPHYIIYNEIYIICLFVFNLVNY